jgi:hypothetical protein
LKLILVNCKWKKQIVPPFPSCRLVSGHLICYAFLVREPTGKSMAAKFLALAAIIRLAAASRAAIAAALTG